MWAANPAGHLLPHLPPSLRASYTVDRTYKRLLGTLDAKELTVWAECLFVDPIADLAVLGVPDGQELIDENKQYEVLTRTMTPLRVESVGARVGSSQSEAAALLRG